MLVIIYTERAHAHPYPYPRSHTYMRTQKNMCACADDQANVALDM